MCSIAFDACDLICKNYAALSGAEIQPSCEAVSAYISDGHTAPAWIALDDAITQITVSISSPPSLSLSLIYDCRH